MNYFNAFVEFVLAVAFVVLTRYVVPWLQGAIAAKDRLALMSLVSDLVAAAEQVYKESGMGTKKKAYVIDALDRAGYEIDGEVDAMIEAEVYRIT